MKYLVAFLLIGCIINGCTSSQPTPAATLTPSFTPSPTRTATSVNTLTPTPVSLPPGQEVIFQGSGSENFTGTRYGQGETVIILANMSIGGEKQWDPFVAAVDKEKFTAVTFDYRDIDNVDEDMVLILGQLKEAGFTRLVCIGASLGTRACTTIAREPETVGLVLIAGSVHHASVAEATYPKLFISGALDVRAFDIQQGYERAAEPKTLLLFQNNRAHGTDLFRSQDREQFLASLIDFVNHLANP